MPVTKEEIQSYLESELFDVFHGYKPQKTDQHYVLTAFDPAKAEGQQGDQNKAEQTTGESQEQPKVTQKQETQIPAHVLNAKAKEDNNAQETASGSASVAQAQPKQSTPDNMQGNVSALAAPQSPTSQEPQNSLLTPREPLAQQEGSPAGDLTATLGADGSLKINGEASNASQEKADDKKQQEKVAAGTTVVTKRKPPKVSSENGASITVPVNAEQVTQKEDTTQKIQPVQPKPSEKVSTLSQATKMAQPVAKPLTPLSTNSEKDESSKDSAQPVVKNEPTSLAETKNAVASDASESASAEPQAITAVDEKQQPQDDSMEKTNTQSEKENRGFSLESLSQNAAISKAMLGASKECALLRAEVEKMTIKPLQLHYLKNGANYALDFKDENTLRSIRTMIIGGDGSISIGFSGGEGMSAYPATSEVSTDDLLKQGVQWSYEPTNIEKLVMGLLPFCADISKVNLFGFEFAQLTFKTIVLKKLP